MKSYKLVNSREIQEKAEKLGYKYACADDSVGCNVAVFLFTQEIGYLRTIDTVSVYNESDCEEITQKDFLALPEPLVVGDLCIIKDLNRTYDVIVIRIKTMNNGRINEKIPSEYYTSDQLTKLTPEQIKILNLEEL